MATISITVPDELLDEARKRLAPLHRAIDDYLVAALYELTSDEAGEPLDAATLAAVEEGMRSPAEELDDAFWQRLDERAERFRRRTGT
jgi:hypothetical protein